jgi:DNA-binding response OmpR family regulator
MAGSPLLYNGQSDTMPRILVVDDEAYLRQALAHALALEQFEVLEADSGEAALAYVLAGRCDMVLLDLALPDLYGTEVMDQARQAYPHLPMIVLTGHATVESAIAAVRADAVDYLLKPVSIRAVVETVRQVWKKAMAEQRQRALLETMRVAFQLEAGEAPEREERGKGKREAHPPTPFPQIVYKRQEAEPSPVGVALDRERRQAVIHANGRHTVGLTESEEAILGCLLDHPEKVFSCRELVRRALGYVEEDEFTAQTLIRPYISRLRKKVEPDPEHPRWIQTIRGRGYLWAAG